MGTQSFLLMLTVVVLVSVVARIGAQTSRPLACHDPNRVCSAYLYYMLSSNESKADVASLFNVGPHDLTLDPHSTGLNSQGLFIRVNCSCISSIYLASASFNATSSTNLASIITQDYTNLAWPKNTSLTVASGSTVPISLLCGCLDNTREYGYLLSYVVQSQDSLAKLAARFDSSISSMVLLNNITNENVIHDDQVYYLPINIAPLVTPITSASVPDSLPPAVLLSGGVRTLYFFSDGDLPVEFLDGCNNALSIPNEELDERFLACTTVNGTKKHGTSVGKGLLRVVSGKEPVS